MKKQHDGGSSANCEYCRELARREDGPGVFAPWKREKRHEASAARRRHLAAHNRGMLALAEGDESDRRAAAKKTGPVTMLATMRAALFRAAEVLDDHPGRVWFSCAAGQRELGALADIAEYMTAEAVAAFESVDGAPDARIGQVTITYPGGLNTAVYPVYTMRRAARGTWTKEGDGPKEAGDVSIVHHGRGEVALRSGDGRVYWVGQVYDLIGALRDAAQGVR